MQSHSYIFVTTTPSFTTLTKAQRKTYKKEFMTTIQESSDVVVNCYSVLGLKGRTKILLWVQAEKVETVQDMLNTVLHTKLGSYLEITHTLFGLARQTQYSPHAVGHLDTNRKGGQYLIIYPFTKTTAWHMLDFAKRKELMTGHIAIGRKFPQITQLLLYSYGVDDHEFIVSYETDALVTFQDLVIALRSDPVRMYTHNDLPIFTCVYKPLTEVLDYL